MSEQPYRKNAPGPFYVANGMCISCRAPEGVAPDLLGYDEEGCHCYFKKQPTTAREIDRAIEAISVSCCGALKYAGDDPEIKQRLAQLEEEERRRLERRRQKRKWFWWRKG